MSIWAQIGYKRTTTLIPDAATTVDVFAQFTFSGQLLDNTATVNFVIGAGTLPEDVASESVILSEITAIDGLDFITPTGYSYRTSAKVSDPIIVDPAGNLQAGPLYYAAKVTINAVPKDFSGNITVVAYTTYDKVGTVTNRLATQQLSLTVSRGEGSFLSSMERYDPTGNIWYKTTPSGDPLAPMPTGRSGPFSEWAAGKLNVIGGFAGEFVGVTESYDPITNSWTKKSPMPTPRGFGCSAVYADEIYVIGGYDFNPGRAKATVEKYNPGTDTWTELSPLPIPLAFATCTIGAAGIYVFYGVMKFDDADKPLLYNSAVLRYDITGDNWEFNKAFESGVTTTLATNVSSGDTSIPISAGAQLGSFGAVTIDVGGVQETVAYGAFSKGLLYLRSPLVYSHLAGTAVQSSSLTQTRLGANSIADSDSYSVTTLAGLANHAGTADGIGSTARFSSPIGIAIDNNTGNIYVADNNSHTIRKITAGGVVTTFAGQAGISGSTDGPGSSALFNQPFGLATDVSGNVYVCDTGNIVIRKITPSGMVTTLAGTLATPGGADGPLGVGQFSAPLGIAVDIFGTITIADSGGSNIRQVSQSGVVTTLAGLFGNPGYADGTGPAAQFLGCRGVGADDFGNVYIADDGNNVIRKITAGGVTTTVAGQQGVFGHADGVGPAATFRNPYGITSDGSGVLYVCDYLSNNLIRRIGLDGTVRTLAGKSGLPFVSLDGYGSSARFGGPYSITLDKSNGTLYVSDQGGDTVRQLSSSTIIFNGLTSLGASNKTIEIFDAASGTASFAPTHPVLPRRKAGIAVIGSACYVVDGSAEKSEFLDNCETGTANIFTTIANNHTARTSPGCAADGTYVYLVGGQGSGHEDGWLNITATASPNNIRADGKQTASIAISAVDASGDPPPDGIMVDFRGIVYLSGSAGGTPSISLLPVLFSSKSISLVNGQGAVTMLARSDDIVSEIGQLAELLVGNEAAGLGAAPDSTTTPVNPTDPTTQAVGAVRSLYSIAVECTVNDPFYFGTSNTALTLGDGTPSQGTVFNPSSPDEGPSANVSYYIDVASIPDVQAVTSTPVSGINAKGLLDSIGSEIPFGASPHFDAIVFGAGERVADLPPRPTNMMVTASDNENNGSSSDASEVVDAVNGVDGDNRFPVFVNTFIVTDPATLSARRDRTDVADLEEISTDTGGNSFSVVDPTYVPFVIERIMSSAPSSIGSGTIVISHEASGSLYSLSYDVENMFPSDGYNVVPNIAGMTIRYSTDGYNFTDLGVVIQPNTLFVLGTPVAFTEIEYTIRLESTLFNSPILTAVRVQYVEPNVQYLFTYPQEISGQISEMSIVTNQRLPSGCVVEAGVVHGESLMFDRDFVSIAQPAVRDRGTIVAINRIDNIIGKALVRDRMTTTDLVSYYSAYGPWAQDATISIFLNSEPVAPTSYFAVPDAGMILFSNKLGTEDIVEMELENRSQFRVGIKITNPTISSGVLDSFAFMYGTNEGAGTGAINRPPVASNLFVTPSPALPGGPLKANYTFFDPDNDDEDTSQTQITWYRNGNPLPELSGKHSITDSDLLANNTNGNNRIASGDRWSFSVRPSDGKAFGAIVVSVPITVSSVPPTASNIRFRSSNATNPASATSSDILYADFDFVDTEGLGDAGSLFNFLVNGISAQKGTSNLVSPTATDSSGAKILTPGNVITVEVTPFDGQSYGLPTLGTTNMTVSPSVPAVSSVAIAPTLPFSNSVLTLTYVFSDVDGLPDQSQIAWYLNGSQISSLDNATSVTPATGTLAPRQQWYAIVTPVAGTATGTAVQSNTVVIQF